MCQECKGTCTGPSRQYQDRGQAAPAESHGVQRMLDDMDHHDRSRREEDRSRALGGHRPGEVALDYCQLRQVDVKMVGYGADRERSC